MNYQKINCFDMEMCCWDDRPERPVGEIIEIGLCEVDLIDMRVTRRAQYIVKPDHDKISDFCTQLTGHTQKVIDRQGRPLADVLETMKRNFGSTSKIYASWGRDDLYLFDECRQKGIDLPFKEHKNVSTDFRIKTRVRNKRFGMLKAMEMLNMDFEGRHHSGFDDAYNLARLFMKIEQPLTIIED